MQRTILPLFLLSASVGLAQENYVVRPVVLSPLAKDYAPTLLDSTVVMCSLRDRGELLDYRDARSGDPLGDLYAFHWRNGTAQELALFGGALNSKLNDGPATFADHGRTICFTRNQGDPSKPSKAGNLGLFFSTFTDGAWSAPVPFAYNNDRHHVMHAAFSPDGLRLVFASDMEGGAGGADLYVSERIGDEWSEPTNLTALNTDANDVFPAFGADGSLFFSSSRAGGLGKLDLYRAPRKGLKWDVPTALPAPMNSPANDIGYTAFPGGRSGFISSDRDGSERIYSFDLMLEPFTECTKEAPDNLCFRFQTPAGATIPGIPIHPRWDFGDGTVVEQETVEHCYERPGNYTVVLDLIDNATGNIFLKGEPRTIAAQRREQLRIGLSNAPVHGKAVELDAQRTDLKGFSPERCTWDLGDGTIMAGAVVKHSWSAPGSYNLRLDVQGMDALSGRYRSHCITRTIEVTRKGEVAENAATVTPQEFDYQELPADLFALSFLVGDDSDFHIELFASKERVGLNDARFTEVKRFYPVYERYDTERGVFSYTVGQTGDLASAYAVFKKILELQFMSAEVIMVKDEQVADLSALETLNIANLANTVIRSSTVRFANGSWAIHPSFVPQLKKIQDLLLKNPTLDIAIEAHTDAVGADDFNLELSQKRAQSIVDHLAKAGIDRERLMPIGQGENHPIADNAKEAGKALNRRVEFRLAAREEQQASQHRE